MNRISRNISIILKAERVMARRRLAVFRTQIGMFAAAGLVAGIGIIMLNVSGFYALNSVYSPQVSALIVALINLGLALLLGVLASRLSTATELAPVAEVRDLAMEDLEAEMDGVIEEAGQLTENIRRIAQDPMGTLFPAALAPLIGFLIREIKK